MSQTVQITSTSHFAEVLSASRIVVVDFYADWCGPCKAIAPMYEQLSSQLSRPGTITFTKVNTDRQREIVQTYGITAMPTFMIFKQGRETKRIRGADPKALDAAVKQLAQEAAKSGDDGGVGSSGVGSSSAGSSSAASGSGPWSAFAAPRGYSDITDSVDLLGLDFLNMNIEVGDKRSVFASGKPPGLDGKGAASKDGVQSDTDEQLMLYIPFQSTLKLHSLHLTSIIPSEAQDGDELPMRPKTLHLYTHRSTVLDFAEAEDTPAVQTIELKESDWDAKTSTAKVELRFVKFQNISSLVIFVENGDGGRETTRIDRIRLFGETGEKRAMGKLEKVGEDS